MKSKLLVSTAILLGLGVSTITTVGTQVAQAADASKVTAVGSTALQPLVEQAAAQFQTENSKVTVDVQGGGSGTGLSQVQAKAVSVGNSDVFAEEKEGVDAKQLVDHKVAVVGMAPVVNKDVEVKNLSMDQLKGIFTGEITNWNEVGGQDEEIVVINRAKGSGTRATFETNVLKGAEAVTTQEQDSNGTVQKVVETTPGAISYLAFSYINDQIKSVSIDNVAPTEKNVTTNDWKIWSYEHMYTNGKAKGATNKFLAYMNSKSVQKTLVKKLGYISIKKMKVQKDAKNVVTNK